MVELSDGLMPGADRDLVRPLQKRIEKRYARILAQDPGREARAACRAACARASRARTRRRPRSSIGCWWRSGAAPTAMPSMRPRPASRSMTRGIIAVDKQMRTNVPHIFAIGDIAGAPMLAHKATHEAKVAAEVAAGHKAAFDARCIPSVAYTDPEIAWVGINETDAKARGIEFRQGHVSVGRERPLARAEPRRGLHQDPVRQADPARHRRRHRRHQRRRIDRGDRGWRSKWAPMRRMSA